MSAPFYKIAAASVEVQVLLGTPPRIEPWGLFVDSEPRVYPYVTFRGVGGNPENYLSGRPDADHTTLQVDVWLQQPHRRGRWPRPFAMRLSSIATSLPGGVSPVTLPQSARPSGAAPPHGARTGFGGSYGGKHHTPQAGHQGAQVFGLPAAT